MAESIDVQKLADLSHIGVSQDEAAQYAEEIRDIVDFVSRITNAETPAAEKRLGVVRNALRADGEPHETGAYTEAVLQQAPSTAGQYVTVRKVIQQ